MSFRVFSQYDMGAMHVNVWVLDGAANRRMYFNDGLPEWRDYEPSLVSQPTFVLPREIAEMLFTQLHGLGMHAGEPVTDRTLSAQQGHIDSLQGTTDQLFQLLKQASEPVIKGDRK